MRRKPSAPPSAPRSAKRPQDQETPEQKKTRVLDRTNELVIVIKKGESPEEAIDKGLALVEIKKLRPWRHDGHGGGFNKWVRRNLPFKVGKANAYIRIATGIRLDLVAGKNLCFDALEAISEFPAALHQELIQAAESGAPARKLRLLGQGAKAPNPESPQERAERAVRQIGRMTAEVRVLREQMENGHRPSAQTVQQLRDDAAVLEQLIAGLPGGESPPPGPADQGGGPGPEPGAKVDPIGSTSAPCAPVGGPSPPPAPPPARPPARPKDEPARPPATPSVPPSTPAVTSAPQPMASVGPGPSLQLPAEVLSFRPLFRFFHEGVTPGRQDCVQDMLCSIVRGNDRTFAIKEMRRGLEPFLYDGHPMKRQMDRLAAGLRAEGMAGRRFALYCLIGAHLPGLPERLVKLSQATPPVGLADLVRYYRNLILGMS